MSPLAKEIIDKLNREEDELVLSEVLDFYEYVKQKKQRELQRKWERVEEDDPTEEEKTLYQDYKNKKDEIVTLENVIKELNLNEE
ncbi:MULTISPECIES: hypothetical protein [unclassified Clostridium]|uniref:hypothetical protein n=1 Tax=unclassified Clostridium TaxID=2614128 RepID=UPI00029865D1|nr:MULTISPECIES: hypothetical protein [unclassified Clostridium]EKQ54725.1 MAG: hypothetical protein A370_03076 [Clostridium sp. Maddingley MBC34-26]